MPSSPTPEDVERAVEHLTVEPRSVHWDENRWVVYEAGDYMGHFSDSEIVYLARLEGLSPRSEEEGS